MPRVFIVQNPSTRNANGEWVPKFDLKPAEAFGELVVLLPPGDEAYRLGELPERLSATLMGERGFSREDHILALGNPAAIAIATHMALRNTGGFASMLRYDRNRCSYRPERIDLSAFA